MNEYSFIILNTHSQERTPMPTDPIHDQLAAARRTQILDAATHVFAAKGFHATTIKDIARQAGLADGTLYLYFANKTALLFAILDRLRQRVLATTDLPTPTPTGDLADLLAAYLSVPLTAFQQDEFTLFRAIMAEALVNDDLRAQYLESILNPTVAMAAAAITDWVAQGRLSAEQAELLPTLLSSIVHGLLVQRILGDPVLAAHWDDLPTRLAALIAAGLQATKDSAE